jgi:hypothetical protein
MNTILHLSRDMRIPDRSLPRQALNPSSALTQQAEKARAKSAKGNLVAPTNKIFIHMLSLISLPLGMLEENFNMIIFYVNNLLTTELLSIFQ